MLGHIYNVYQVLPISARIKRIKRKGRRIHILVELDRGKECNLIVLPTFKNAVLFEKLILQHWLSSFEVVAAEETLDKGSVFLSRHASLGVSKPAFIGSGYAVLVAIGLKKEVLERMFGAFFDRCSVFDDSGSISKSA